MSSALGLAVICEQCEEVTFLLPDSDDGMRARLDAIGWAPYGTGITPFAEENAAAGMYACPRCTNELVDGRLNRLAAAAIRDLAIPHPWVVVRSADEPSDFLRVIRPEGAVQVEFASFKTDDEMREAIKRQLVRALHLQV
jgi:hypothetical protein